MNDTPPQKAQFVNPSIKRKHIARLIAVQTIYACMIDAEVTARDMLDWQLALPKEQAIIVSAPDKKLLEALVYGVTEMHGALTEKCAELLGERWTAKRMPSIMRAILLCGLYEVIYTPTLATNIILDSYVGVADAFLDDKDVGFVNGVLQEMVKVLR
jgi:N utilization substance protein B